jgi:outer membrane protein assembly factor BamB
MRKKELSGVNKARNIRLLLVISFLSLCSRYVIADALPDDFPEITVPVCSGPADGDIFLSNFTQDSSVTTTPYLIILDNTGTPIEYRQVDSPINTDFKRQPNGTTTYFQLMDTNTLGTNDFAFYFVNRQLNATGSISAVTTGVVTALRPEWLTDVHELRMQDDGHGYLLAYRLAATNMLSYGGKLNAFAVDMAIQEVDPAGNLYWHWSPTNFFTHANTTPDVPLTNRIVDYAHCNSIDIDTDGHILLSTRYFDEITKINRQTGEIIWRMGGSCCSNNQFTFINDDQPQNGGGTFTGFSHQHGVRRLANGNLLFFDNGNLKDPPYSRAVEYNVDEINMTAEKVWSYSHTPPISSTEMGFAQRLDNGNTFISWGGGTSRTAITEVTPQSNVVFELTLPDGVHSYRAFKQAWTTNISPTNTFLPSPYRPDGWPAQHMGAHNSDWVPRDMLDLQQTNELDPVQFMLRDPANPVVCAGGGVIVVLDGKEYFIVTLSALKYPNLYALDMSDGSVYWQAAPPTNVPFGQSAPGPDSCASTIAPIADKYGNIYLADCHYVYCYRIESLPDQSGYQPWVWRQPMPNLKTYDPNDGLWHPSSDPTAADTKGFPFMSFVLTPEVDGDYYVGGFTVQGETFMFDHLDGSLVAEAYLETNMIGAVSNQPPCDPYRFAETNNPMIMSSNNPILFGIWATGITNTTDPDLKYFMNPCQLKGYMDAGTFGTGAMIANNPCRMRNPTNPAACRLFIAGSQSEYLKQWDADTNTLDAIMYAVDFDPTAPHSNRLTVCNYVITNYAGTTPQFAFEGRMIDGESSATSPDLSYNEKWLFCGDKAGTNYCFDTTYGRPVWTYNTGEALGSPTTFQNEDENGNFLFMTVAGYDPWAFMINAETGQIASNETYGLLVRKLPLSRYIQLNCWRTNDAYQQVFHNSEGLFTRNAIGSSIISGCSNRVEMIFTVGWKYPIHMPPAIADMATIPTHQQIVYLDVDKIWTATNVADMIAATYMDTNGTSEAGFIPSPLGNQRGVMFYISQSCCMAQFMDVNSAEGRFDSGLYQYLYMPEGMRSLYMKPYGGLGLYRIPYIPDFTVTPVGQDDATISLCWDAVPPDGEFTLQSSDNLLAPDWQKAEPTNLWPVSGTVWTTRCSNTLFFRLLSEP